MKTTELMINDWVYEGRIHPIKVKQNYGKSISYKEDEYSHEVEESCLLPIPLTAEIFKANGFKYDKAFLYWYKEIEKGLWLTICVWFHKLYNIEITRGQYSYDGTLEKEVRINTEPHIHRLQHALRLCGFEELADNFKIE